MEKQQPGFDYEALRKKTLEQLRSGTNLFGKDGAFAPMLKDFLELALDAELDNHLDDQQRRKGNRKNGYGTKQLKISEGTLDLSAPRDRLGEFEPQTVRKKRNDPCRKFRAKDHRYVWSWHEFQGYFSPH